MWQGSSFRCNICKLVQIPRVSPTSCCLGCRTSPHTHTKELAGILNALNTNLIGVQADLQVRSSSASLVCMSCLGATLTKRHYGGCWMRQCSNHWQPFSVIGILSLCCNAGWCDCDCDAVLVRQPNTFHHAKEEQGAPTDELQALSGTFATMRRAGLAMVMMHSLAHVVWDGTSTDRQIE